MLEHQGTYFLTEYPNDEFRATAAKRVKQEATEYEEFELYITNAAFGG
jgi:hypothetical protein